MNLRHSAIAISVALAGSLLLVSPAQVDSAEAAGSTITATVNTSACPATPPALINGGFEEFAEPSTDYANSRFNGNQPYKLWHGYGGGPDMHIFFKPDEVPGWQTTDQGFEIQRQVVEYSETHQFPGVNTPNNPPGTRSGVATAATAAVGSGQFDLYSPQPAEGSYWAELNAFTPNILSQRVEVPENTRVFWSIKHRGRSTTQEEMKVNIGLPGAVSHQTGFQKFAPTNADKFSGYPTYGTSITSNEIKGSASDGWNMYTGTLVSPAANSPSTSVIMSFEFQSITGGAGYAAVGNFLDDVQFTAFMACPIEITMHQGQTAEVDVTGLVEGQNTQRHSYGIDQELVALGNPVGASLADFSSSSNTVSYTAATVGSHTVDYEVAMSLGGVQYTAASRITYTVLPAVEVRFDFQDGATPDQVATVSQGASLSSITRPAPSRAGYTFEGWYTDTVSGQIVDATYSNAVSVSANVTLYGRWSLITPPSPPAPPPPPANPIVSFDFADNSTSNMAVPVGYGQMLTQVALPNPSRTGYVFLGWYTAPSGGQLVDASYASATTVTSNRTLYARWQMIDPTVTFVFGDASTSNLVQTISHSASLSQAAFPTPSRSGYTFLGWFTSPTGSQIADSAYADSISVTSDTFLFGRWDPPIPLVTFDFSDGLTPNQYQSVQQSQSLTATQLPAASRAGYNFLGWYTDPVGGTVVNSNNVSSLSIVQDRTLYARWQIIDPVVTFVFGDGVTATQSVAISHSAALSRVQLPSASRAGYNFLGWFTAPVGGQLVDPAYAISTSVSADITLYGQWRIIDPVVTFVFGDGYTANQSVAISHSQPLSRIQIPGAARVGYSFLGWYTSPTGGQLVDSALANSTLVTSDLVLFGRWDPPIPLVTFEFGDGITPNQYVSVQQNQTLSAGQLPVPSRAGFSFLGWTEDPAIGSLLSASSLSSLVITGNMTLYAVWELNPTEPEQSLSSESQPSASPGINEAPGENLAYTGFDSWGLLALAMFLVGLGLTSMAAGLRKASPKS